jgi:Glycosyl hydrolase family 9/Cellulase N-terminal ig-like domain
MRVSFAPFFSNSYQRVSRLNQALIFGWLSLAVLLGLPLSATAQTGGPLPYAAIANPLPDTLDQLYRDSVNIRFSKIRVNQAGYRTGDPKFFYTVGASGSTFKVIDVGGTQVATGNLTATGKTTSGQLSITSDWNAVKNNNTRYTMSSPTFSGNVSEGEIPANVAPGRYRIVVGADSSAPFVIDEQVYSWVKDALLKFFGINRSGNTDSWFHPPAHLKDGPNGDGSLAGGWYDCGDHLKESQTMSYALSMLAIAAAGLPERDLDKYGQNQNNTLRTDGIPDILYESKIGVDFFMKSYNVAKGDPAKMWTSVGDFGLDHNYYGPPEFQDNMPTVAGGPIRQLRNEAGSNVMGRVAAGLALFSKMYASYDKAYADQCLAASIKMYAHGKNLRKPTSSSAYSGENTINDDMALAAVSLLWATHDTTYKYDLIANPALGTFANPFFTTGTFPGGWMVATNTTLQKGGTNTSWANVHTPTLWAFYKLILKDPTTAAACGFNATQRLDAIEDVVFNVIDNIGWLQGGSASIDLPSANPQLPGGHTLTYDPLWKINTKADVVWVWNRYIAGNITEFYCYYDIAKDLQGVALPHTPASVNWKAEEVKTLIVRQMDYMLGVNPWDISMIYGIGAKSFNHPHHRASNPEGMHIPGGFYKYRPPVGALQGGFPPEGGNGSVPGVYTEYWNTHFYSEICLDGTASILLPAVGLSKPDTVTPIEMQVKIEYVGTDNAVIVVRQNRFGKATIRFGTDATTLNLSKTSDTANSEHRFSISGLKPGTLYYLEAEATDVKGNRGFNDNGGKKFLFTTLANPPGQAQIAQVKVCNVTHNTAEILWFTPNGTYDSKVVYGTGKPPTQIKDGDIAGHPVKFHYVKIEGLKEKTQYWFYVESNGTRDDNLGQFYTFTTRVEHVAFDIRAMTYDWGGKKYLGFNIVNQDKKSYDSLDVRLYMRTTAEKIADFGVRVDIGQAYLSTGYLDPTNAFKTALDTLIQKQKPVRMDDTFDPATNTYIWYVSLPMGNAIMSSGARFRVDVTFTKRNEHNDLLDEPATYVPGPSDWSWSKHSRASGDPADFGGIQSGTKEDVDDKYVMTEVNPYMTVYRKGQFVWGYSPSKTEMSTKVANYVMDVQITSPLQNPPEDYKKLDKAASTVLVKGKVTITEAGKLTDIWVNGSRIPDLASAATYNQTSNDWTLNIPVKLNSGANEVDITLFGGADPLCQGCVGCAFVNRHFYLEFDKANAFPSTLALLTPAGQPLPSLATIGQTQFLVEVQDKNGDGTAGIDSLQVKAANPNQGDSITLLLVETAPRSGVFRSQQPVLTVDAPPNATGAGQISMADGDSIWVTYVDPTDEEDTSKAFLFTPATFPLATIGWIQDLNGDGSADHVVVLYSMPLKGTPDSLFIGFPDATKPRTVLPSNGGFAVNGNRLDINLVPSFPNGATAFVGDNTNSGRSFLTHDAKTRTSAFTLLDSVGPVLNRVLLLPASEPGKPDTLAVSFSEAIRYTTTQAHPFLGQHAGVVASSDAIQVKGVLDVQPLRLVFLLDPGSKLLLSPGDSLHIAAGIQDGIGNKPGTQNPWVVVEGNTRPPPPIPPPPTLFDLKWDDKIYDSEMGPANEAPLVLANRQPGGAWIPIQGSHRGFARLCHADCGAPVAADLNGSLARPSALISINKPFRYETAVYSNLGVFVTGATGNVGTDLLQSETNPSAPISIDPTTGLYQLRLIWNGTSSDGNRAGIGAYVWKIAISLPNEPTPFKQEFTRTIGLMRRN